MGGDDVDHRRGSGGADSCRSEEVGRVLRGALDRQVGGDLSHRGRELEAAAGESGQDDDVVLAGEVTDEWTRAELDQVRTRWIEEIAAKARRVRDEPLPEPSTIWKHIYAEDR